MEVGVACFNMSCHVFCGVRNTMKSIIVVGLWAEN